MKMHSGIAAVALGFAVACSSPDANNGPIVIDDDVRGNNPADMGPTLDVNNQLTPDLQVDEGCQAEGCPDTQVCNMQTGICVDCLTNAECGSNGMCDTISNKCFCADGYHLCDNTCVSNDSVDSCGSSCAPCPTDPNGTATCDGTSCGIDCDGELLFDDVTQTCVGCVDNSDCGAPSASTCDAGACVACAANDDCAHIGGAPLCDAGVCVECSPADESACGDNSCDPATGTCTTVPRGSVGECRACNADSECTTGYGCVAMEFDGNARPGGYCLPVDTGGCEAPLPTSVARTSLSGTAGDYCTLNEALTTCEALLDYNAPGCSDASDCGDPNLDDALCEPIEFELAARCTFPCVTSDECPSDLFGCNLGGPYCGSY